MLHNGTYNATPTTGMWPLLCHEIGLSYEQEDKVRTTQRAILAQHNSWISRHTAVSTVNVLNAMHSALTQFHTVASERERGIKQVLTPEQRRKFLKWAKQNSNRIHEAVPTQLEHFNEEHEYQLDPQRHVAANLYIVNHRLSNINSRLLGTLDSTSTTAPIVHSSKLKKLSRRPCFESLAVQDAAENNKSSSKLSREASFPSTGSLKRTLNELSGDKDNNHDAHHPPTPNTTGITVESAHAAAQPGIRAIFQGIMDIIPPSYVYQMQLQHFKAVPVSSSVSAQEVMNVNSHMASTLPTMQQQHQQQKPQHALTTSTLLQPQEPISSDEMDIPMPTPVSVLFQTQDEFLDVDTTSTGVPIEVTSAMQQQQPVVENSFIPSIEYAPPEPVPSTPNNIHGLLPARSYASAPNLLRNDFDMPTTNLMPVPEEGLHKSNMETEDAFDLEELGDPNDWAIGESFDLDMK